jgi:aspartyl-tRNA(Asn)/glutamyl-tRNA(Gln) amidotransferase subunit C
MSFDIDKIAHLSRIALSEEDRAALGPKLVTIVNMIDQLQSVNTDHVEAMTNPFLENQRLRPDAVLEHDCHEKYQAVAPKVAAGLYLVPKVID